VYQLERAFWPFLTKQTTTTVWNGYETPDPDAHITFACVDSVANYIENTGGLPTEYDLIGIDECHHATTPTYSSVVTSSRCGKSGGPFLVGLTATPWRSDGSSLEGIF